MIRFIDDHREVYGVEPICRVLPIAPSTYYVHAARRADPEKQTVRARSDAALMIEIQRVFEANFCVYGVRKIWRQLAREGIVTARCTVARLMRRLGLAGVGAWQDRAHHDLRSGEGHGAPSSRSSTPPWSGSTGTTTVASSRPSATSLLPRPKRAIMLTSATKPWPPDPRQTASEKPGAVHSAVLLDSRTSRSTPKSGAPAT